MQGVPPNIFSRLRLRPTALVLCLLALAPAVYVAARVVEASRDVAYWDEFDTALNLVLQLDRGIGVREFFSRLFEISNEHRMVTSRLMFAASYWLSGTVDFAVISWLGNLSLLGLCGLLLWVAGTTERRVKLGFLLAMLLFQLEHYENFLWSGSSIDHFQVVLLAGAAVIGVARGTRPGLLMGMLAAVLATFTLAHGIVVWAIGLAMLAPARRFSALGMWCGVGALAAAGFLAGFQLNMSQRFVDPSLGGAAEVASYWFALIGAVPALGHAPAAPWLGAALLIALAVAAWRGSARREPVAFPLACYAVAALGLIAFGRAAESGGAIHSRYYVLGALAWALTAFLWLERHTHPRRPYTLLWSCVPLLVAFNVAANRSFSAPAYAWLECRDRAAVRFKQHGVDGRGPFALYPMPARSTQLLDEAERRGVYRMPPVCERVEFPRARPSERITYYVEEVEVTGRAAAVVGWAAIPGMPSERGKLHVVLRSGTETHVYTAITVTRPDVATALQRPDCQLSGFRFARRRDNLPSGEYQIGFLIAHAKGEEYIMTDHKLRLVADGKAPLATAD